MHDVDPVAKLLQLVVADCCQICSRLEMLY